MPNSSADPEDQDENPASRVSTLEGLEKLLEDAKEPHEVFGFALQLAFAKSHILACSTPRVIRPTEMLLGMAQGSAFGAFNVIAEMASLLAEGRTIHPAKYMEAMRGMVEVYLQAQAETIDVLLSEFTPPTKETVQ